MFTVDLCCEHFQHCRTPRATGSRTSGTTGSRTRARTRTAAGRTRTGRLTLHSHLPRSCKIGQSRPTGSTLRCSLLVLVLPLQPLGLPLASLDPARVSCSPSRMARAKVTCRARVAFLSSLTGPRANTSSEAGPVQTTCRRKGCVCPERHRPTSSCSSSCRQPTSLQGDGHPPPCSFQAEPRGGWLPCLPTKMLRVWVGGKAIWLLSKKGA